MQKIIITTILLLFIIHAIILIFSFGNRINYYEKLEYNYCYIKLPISRNLNHKWIHTNHNPIVIDRITIECDKCNHNIEIGSNISEVTDK